MYINPDSGAQKKMTFPGKHPKQSVIHFNKKSTFDRESRYILNTHNNMRKILGGEPFLVRIWRIGVPSVHDLCYILLSYRAVRSLKCFLKEALWDPQGFEHCLYYL